MQSPVMRSLRSLVILSVAVFTPVYGAAAQARSGERRAAAQDPRIDRDEEMRTMVEVLADSLDQSGLKAWHRTAFAAPSPFDQADSRIQAQYIPTVGAIFTIPVRFLLRAPKSAEPAEAEKEKPEDAEQRDLWEKHWRKPAPGAHEIEVEVNQSQAGERTYRTLRSRKGAAAPGPAFDAQKVETLRGALIECVARYGYRLTGVDPSERILLVVEGPSLDPRSDSLQDLADAEARIQTTRQTLENVQRLRNRTKGPSEPQESVGEVEKEVGELKNQAGDMQNQAGEMHKQAGDMEEEVERYLFATRSGDGEGVSPRDRCLIAIKKSDLDSEKKAEDLGKKTEERWF